MDASKLTSEQTRELTELRRRAYGLPDGPRLDADESERLAELERLARGPNSSSPAEPAPESRSATPDAGVAQHPRDAQKPHSAVAVAGPPGTDEAAHPLWRSWAAPVAAGVGIGLVLGLVAGLTLPPLSAPRPDITLGRTDERWAPQWESYLTSYEIVPETMQGHDRLHEVLMVWTADGIYGDRCLLIGHEPTMRLTVETCTARDRYPTFDLIVTAQLRGVLDGAYPIGTTLRLTAGEEAVDVRVLAPAEEGRVAGS